MVHMEKNTSTKKCNEPLVWFFLRLQHKGQLMDMTIWLSFHGSMMYTKKNDLQNHRHKREINRIAPVTRKKNYSLHYLYANSELDLQHCTSVSFHLDVCSILSHNTTPLERLRMLILFGYELALCKKKRYMQFILIHTKCIIVFAL